MTDLTIVRLKEVLRYDPETGKWWRLSTLNPRWPIGAQAGCLQEDDYTLIWIDGRLYRSARLAWFYMTGTWPQFEIDHKDTDKSNDRWINLREAAHDQNNRNKKLTAKNTSGLKGVSWHKKARKWQVKIRVDGKQKHLGLFEDIEEGHRAYCQEAAVHHGDFARTA